MSAAERASDVIVVGSRCAGAPLAALLARAGARVTVLERAVFPHDTLSTHLFEADAIRFLDELGVTPALRQTGAPFVTRTDSRIEDVRWQAGWPLHDGDLGGVASIRRHVLDPILTEAAEQAGANVLTGTRVIELVREGERVAGVVAVDRDGTRTELRARLVVGADGRNSTVARLAGARHYNVTPNRRALYYGYFEGADMREPTFVFHRWADRFVLGCPTDGELYIVLVLPELAERDAFRADPDLRFLDHAMSCEPVAAAIGPGRRTGKLYGLARWTGYFRDASGPGWVLVGDAGHFKDPAAGRGIGDAFLQAGELARRIIGTGGADGPELDRELRRWGRWRDREFAAYYWFGTDLGDAGPVPAVLPELVRGLQARGREGDLLEIQAHRKSPAKALSSPPRVLGAVSRLLVHGAPRGRTGMLREVGGLLGQDMRRRALGQRPKYERATADAEGATEVDEAVVA